ncbi:MAG: hypothetical protein FD180_542 [Planctomycetota bacterium]|nr:MAG: hypothetical protein FD180_542 [Planctomycetota bacterium]
MRCAIACLWTAALCFCGCDSKSYPAGPVGPPAAPSRIVEVDVQIRSGAMPPVLEFEVPKSGERYSVDLRQVRMEGKRALASFLEAAGGRGATDLRLTGSLPRSPVAAGQVIPLRLRGAEVLTVESLPFLCPASEARGRCLYIERALWVIRSAQALKKLWQDLLPRSGDALHADFSRQMIVVLVEPTVGDFQGADTLAVLGGGCVTVEWQAQATGRVPEGASWHALVLPAREEPLSGILKLSPKGLDGEMVAPEMVVLQSTVYGR